MPYKNNNSPTATTTTFVCGVKGKIPMLQLGRIVKNEAN
jgi:hypothetical protein